MDYQSPFGLLGDRITSGFGRRPAPRTPFGFGSSFHRGMDMSLQGGASGYPAEAVGEGIVTFAGKKPGYGNLVEVTHPDGYVSRYGHLQEIGNIAIGDQIASGTPVGLVGNTGNSGAPHLHLEMRDPQGTPVDPRSVIDFDASVRAPTPTPADRWESAAPMAVAREELSPVAAPEAAPMSAGLLSPSLDEGRFAAGPVAQGMGELQGGLLSANMAMGAPDEGRFASGPVAQGLDAMRGGLLAQAAAAPDEARFAAGPVAQGVDGLRAGLLSYSPSAAPAAAPSPAAAAIESVAPSAPNLADAYSQLGQSLDDADVIGLSGTKTYNTLSPMGELNAPANPAAVSNPGLFAQGVTGLAPNTVQTTSYAPEQAPQAEIAGPASPTVETNPTPPADVGSFPAAPQTTGQKATKIAGRVAGALLGSAAAGPIGGLLGGMLGNEMASGKGLFSGSSPQSIGGLLSSLGSSVNNIGQGSRQSYSVWGGGTPMGTQATATDGSRITQLGNGMIARTDPNGVTTTFNDRGNIVGSPVSTGGLLAGIGRDFSDAFGGGSSSGGTGGVDTSGMSPGLW